MEQFLIILGSEFSKFFQYFLLLMIGLFVGILYVFRSIKSENFTNRVQKVIYIAQGIGSSALVTWISYEIVDYFFNFPDSLRVAISGGVGYLGAESVSALVLASLKKVL
ncbi:hypothetical protein VN0664_15360 [Helicobacter pylori]|nr:hypothetical protein VN0664_15360 [Helicobacter pylori]